MLYIFTGKSSAGKDSICKLLQKEGIERIVSYTTRPIRKNEVDGIDYHFTDEELFKNNLDMFICLKNYKVASGDIWYYGFNKNNFNNIRNNDYITIADPDGATELRKRYPHDTKIIYIEAYMEIRKNRYISRGGDVDEMLRRFRADEIDFTNFPYDIKLENNTVEDLEKNLKDILKLIGTF